MAETKDPFAEFGGRLIKPAKAAAPKTPKDPFAEFGGKALAAPPPPTTDNKPPTTDNTPVAAPPAKPTYVPPWQQRTLDAAIQHAKNPYSGQNVINHGNVAPLTLGGKPDNRTASPMQQAKAAAGFGEAPTTYAISDKAPASAAKPMFQPQATIPPVTDKTVGDIAHPAPKEMHERPLDNTPYMPHAPVTMQATSLLGKFIPDLDVNNYDLQKKNREDVEWYWNLSKQQRDEIGRVSSPGKSYQERVADARRLVRAEDLIRAKGTTLNTPAFTSRDVDVILAKNLTGEERQLFRQAQEKLDYGISAADLRPEEKSAYDKMQEQIAKLPHGRAAAMGHAAVNVAGGLTSPGSIGMFAGFEFGLPLIMGPSVSALTAMGLSTKAATMTLGAIQTGGFVVPQLVDSIKGGVNVSNATQQMRASGKFSEEQIQEKEWEAYSEIVGNALVMAGLMGVGTLEERYKGRIELNKYADEAYKKKFSDLTPKERQVVLLNAAVAESPELQVRVEREVKRMRKAAGIDPKYGDIDPDYYTSHRLPLPPRTEEQAEAVRHVLDSMIQQRAAKEAYRVEAARREANARAAIYEAEKAADRPPAEPDIKVSDRRPQEKPKRGRIYPAAEPRYTAEEPMYKPEPGEPAYQFTDRRSAPAMIEEIQRVNAAEKPIQEYAEKEHGASFTSLPFDQKRLVQAHFERTDPQAWEAFQSTPTYESYNRHADAVESMQPVWERWNKDRGTGDPAAAGADLDMGLARLILAHTDVPAAMKANPEVGRQLNEFSEAHLGHSFDSSKPEDRPSVFGAFLRSKPEAVEAFLTPDLAERIRNGQHIDLANLEESLKERQEVKFRMEQRDLAQQAMDFSMVGEMVDRAREEHNRVTDGVIKDSALQETAQGEAITDAVKGITRLAARISLDGITDKTDLFHVEQFIRRISAGDRSTDMNEFLAQMKRIRLAAERVVLDEYREGLIAQMRADIEGGRQTAIRDIVMLEDQRAASTRLAGYLSTPEATPEQHAKADALKETAEFLKRKEEAAVAAVASANNPPVIKEKLPRVKAVLGRATVIRLNSGEEVPAHYAVVEVGETITSHNPLDNYNEDNRYPKEAQPRQYKVTLNNDPERRDPAWPLQGGVEERASNPKPDLYHSDITLPNNGPATIREDGVVIAGNGREMGKKLLAARGKYDVVSRDLLDRLKYFGIPEGEVVGKFKNPDLVRILDEDVSDPDRLARYGVEMNRDDAMGQSPQERAIALSRLLTPEVVQKIAAAIDSVPGDPSLREAMRARSQELGEIMRDAGMVDPKKRSEFFAGNDMTEAAKDVLEQTLAGYTVSRPDILLRASSSVKAKLAKASIGFIRAAAAGPQWDLASYNSDAVELQARVQERAELLRMMMGAAEDKTVIGGESMTERYLHPERYKLSNLELALDGQSAHPPVHPAVEALSMLLEENPRVYRDVIADYADAAAQGGATLLSDERSPAEVFTETIGIRKGKPSIVEVAPEEWGRVSALPEVEKEQLAAEKEAESERDPEADAAALDDQIAADLQPEMQGIEDLPEGVTAPKTVDHIRAALSALPNITPDQAAAELEIIQNILPNALGETLENLMENYNLSFAFGGKDAEGRRAYIEFVSDTQAVIRVMDNADVGTFTHEVTHFVRRMMPMQYQHVANEFVGFTPELPQKFNTVEAALKFIEARKASHPDEAWELVGGSKQNVVRKIWTDRQEEMFTQAHERYQYDGGRRKGKLEKAFATISKAMRAVYDAATAMKLVKPNPALEAMFDKWYDWSRGERKPITASHDIEAINKAAKGGEVVIPPEAALTPESPRLEPRGANVRNMIYLTKEMALDFVRRNKIAQYQLFDGKDGVYYLKADVPNKKLYQPGLSGFGDLVREAKALEERLKKGGLSEREEAQIRSRLNSLNTKLGVSTFIIGQDAKPPIAPGIIDLSQGVSGKFPTIDEPTTPEQAAAVMQAHGAIPGGEYGTSGSETDVRKVSDETSRVPESEGAKKLSEGAVKANGKDEAAGRTLSGRRGAGGGRGKDSGAQNVKPLRDVKPIIMLPPKRPRGTPVADLAAWQEYAEAIGLPAGTPPPTVRIPDDLRDMMIYPGQSEAVENMASGLQQYDAVVLASPPGTGKTFMALALADQVLGTGGDRVGLIVATSHNMIHAKKGWIDVGKQVGVQVDAIPKNLAEVQGGGLYAITWSKIRGDKSLLKVPWDFVIFDEAQNARKCFSSAQGEAAVKLGHAAKKVVYVSGTPWHTALELAYAHKLGAWPEGGFFEFARQFGLREVGPNQYAGGFAPKEMLKFRQQLIERGQWASLYQDLNGVSAYVVAVPQTPETAKGVRDVRSAFEFARQLFMQAEMTGQASALRGYEATYLKRYVESSRLPEALDAMEKAMNDGWNPILFTEYRSGSKEEVDGIIDDIFEKIPMSGMAKVVRDMLPKLPNVVDAVREKFGQKVGIFAGSANQIREEERVAFLDGEKQGLLTTYAAGGTGVSFHDEVGNRPRMNIFLGPPWSGFVAKQADYRVWRYGTKSDVAALYFTSDALPEIKILTTKVLPRMQALNAAVYGMINESELSKTLREQHAISDDALAYAELDAEETVDASEFTHKAKSVPFILYKDFEMPKSAEAIGPEKGMKYKQQPKRLYQGAKNAEPAKEGRGEGDATIASTARGTVADEKHARGDEARRVRDERKSRFLFSLRSPYEETPAFKNWFRRSEVVDESDKPLVVFRGDNRGDAVGNTLKKSRSTSGRFYFTDNPAVASKYAEGKLDSKHIQDNLDYQHWFMFPDYKHPRERNAPNLDQVWYRLSEEEKNRVKDAVLNTSTDNQGKVVFGDGSLMGKEGVEREVKQAQGNWLKAAKEIWLNSGSVFDQEEKFSELLDHAGLKHEFKSPLESRPTVTPVYLSIQKSLDTSNIPPEVTETLRGMAKRDRTRANQLTYDHWDKTGYTPKEWVERFEDDLKNNTTYAWTSIPEKVTKALQSMGYDGIRDRGGKNGGETNTVWIAFEPEQVKGVFNRGTFDPNSPNILFHRATKAWDPDIKPTDLANRIYTRHEGALRNDKPMVVVNDYGLRMIADAATNNKAVDSDGFALGKIEVDLVLDRMKAHAADLRSLDENMAAGNVEQLIQDITAARDKVGGVVVLGQKTPEVRGEEQFHGFQFRNNADFPDIIMALSQDPLVLKAGKTLVGRYGYASDPTTITLEATAKCFNGDFTSAGLTRTDAATLLTKFLDLMAKERGAEVFNDVPNASAEIEQLIKEGFERHAIPYETRGTGDADGYSGPGAQQDLFGGGGIQGGQDSEGQDTFDWGGSGEEPPQRTLFRRKEIDTSDPFRRDAQRAAEEMYANMPEHLRRAFAAALPTTHVEAVEAGKKAFAIGESVPEAVKQSVDSQVMSAKLAVEAQVGPEVAAEYFKKDGFKKAVYKVTGLKGLSVVYRAGEARQKARGAWHDVWLQRFSAGDQAVRLLCEMHGQPKAGKELQRLMLNRWLRISVHEGELHEKFLPVYMAINDGVIKEDEFPKVVDVLEGKYETNDERINRVVGYLREAFQYAKDVLAEKNAYMPGAIDDEGRQYNLYWKDIPDKPTYWPHHYDWRKEIWLPGEKEGDPPTRTTLGEIHNMSVGDERRAKMIERYAAERKISVLDAEKFFSKNRRGTRLEGHIEKKRETTIPDYMKDLGPIHIYISEWARTISNVETVGQLLEKANPLIYSVHDVEVQKAIKQIVANDLNPETLGENNRWALRIASQWTVLTKMGESARKVLFHSWKQVLPTNMISTIHGFFDVTMHPSEMRRMCRDAGALLDYVQEDLALEFGLRGSLDQKFLKYSGFTPLIYLTRLWSAASGRYFLEKYAAPALMKDPTNAHIRDHLTKMFGFSDEDLNRISKEGPTLEDTRLAMVGTANWTTGSGRPSELPMNLRTPGTDWYTRQVSLFARLRMQLKTYQFKCFSLVNRTVFEGLRNPDWSQKDYMMLGRWLIGAGAAGMGLRLMMIAQYKVTDPQKAEEEIRRLEGIKDHPQDALWIELANVSLGMAFYPGKLFFDRLATHNKKDLKAFTTGGRAKYAIQDAIIDPSSIDSDIIRLFKGVADYAGTYAYDGIHHKKPAAARRKDIEDKMLTDIVPWLKTPWTILDKLKKYKAPPSEAPHVRRGSRGTSEVKYPHTATHGETGHRIGSHDGHQWYDLDTGAAV